MNGSFSDDALEQFARLASEKQGVDFAEGDTYDFTRCVRPNGTAYGTSGKCRKGSEEEKGFAPDKHPRKGKVELKNKLEDMRFEIGRARSKAELASDFQSRKKAKTELANLVRRREKILKEYMGWG